MEQHINEIRRMQQLAGINEIKVSQPTNSKNNNISLYNFLNRHIEEFAKDQLQTNENLSIFVFNEYYNWDTNPANLEDENYPYDTEFKDMPQPIQQDMINYLVEKGLEYYGEWKSEEDNDKTYGIEWNLDYGMVYNWTNKAYPGPAEDLHHGWIEQKFKGIIFYVLYFNV